MTEPKTTVTFWRRDAIADEIPDANTEAWVRQDGRVVRIVVSSSKMGAGLGEVFVDVELVPLPPETDPAFDAAYDARRQSLTDAARAAWASLRADGGPIGARNRWPESVV